MDTVLDEAKSGTGLDDFGDDSFREGLEILLHSLRDEARLNPRGETYLYPRIAGHLRQRLQVEDWYRRHPEIDEVPVRAPLFGLGLPRTGSTALSFLLAQDPGIRYIRSWESASPCPPCSTVQGADPRIPPGAVTVTAGSRHHVPVDVHGPMECLDLMALDFKSQIFQAFAHIPTCSHWLAERADFTSTYAYQRRVLKLMSWGEPERSWRLKTPSHVLSLDYLDAVFPDARFVMTHRDPTDVLLSVAEVYADIVGGFSDHVDRRYLGELNVAQWSVGMERVVKFRDGGADSRFFDIDFRAMTADSVGQVRQLYDWLGEPVSDEFEAGMRSWWACNAEHREPSVRADPQDFGMDFDRIRPLFAQYVDHAQRWLESAALIEERDDNPMAVDLTGGIDPSRELVFARAPENPEMRDSASFWIFDEDGEVGLPRVGIEAVAAHWESHALQVNLAFADGRVFRLRDSGPAWPAAGPDGRATVLGGGPLAFTCVTPFRTWTVSFDGQAVQTTSADLVAGNHDGPLVDVAFQVEATMAVPPWVQGAMQADAAASLESTIVGDMMGGPRYEQLFRATTSVRVGTEEHTFSGSGLRIRRQGVRKLEGFWGHCWQSALFPSGKAFGYIAYPPRPDGEPAYNEGYLFNPDRNGGQLIPARVIEAPWLTRLQPLGEAVPVVLETRNGIERIDGLTVVSTHHIFSEADKANLSKDEAAMAANWSFPPLQQAGVRYTWDGEETIGMLERSSMPDKMTG